MLKGYRLITIYLLLVIGLIVCLFSCKGVEYVPVESVRTEYVSRTDTFIQRNSIYYTDSVIIEKNGDTITVQKTKYIYKDRWYLKTSNDTIIKRDSIPVPVPVERKLSKWERICLDYGKLMMGGSLLGVIVVILWLIFWIRRKFL